MWTSGIGQNLVKHANYVYWHMCHGKVMWVVGVVVISDTVAYSCGMVTFHLSSHIHVFVFGNVYLVVLLFLFTSTSIFMPMPGIHIIIITWSVLITAYIHTYTYIHDEQFTEVCFGLRLFIIMAGIWRCNVTSALTRGSQRNPVYYYPIKIVYKGCERVS